MAYKKDWSEFYEITRSKPPRDLLVQALKYVSQKGKVVDIGGGALRDTRHLLKEGFDVVVIDKSPLVADEAKSIANERLHVHITAFEDFIFPADTYVLASAMYALPFCEPRHFCELIRKIKSSLQPGGIFCGQLFGDRDEWSNNAKMTFHTIDKAKELLSDMEIISFNEEEKDDTAGKGETKHWHVFHFIARKKVS